MNLPKFLLGDNTEFSEDIFIIHTEFPRFIVNLSNDDIELFEEVNNSEQPDLEEEMEKLIKQAYEFYDREIDIFSKL